MDKTGFCHHYVPFSHELYGRNYQYVPLRYFLNEFNQNMYDKQISNFTTRLYEYNVSEFGKSNFRTRLPSLTNKKEKIKAFLFNSFKTSIPRRVKQMGSERRMVPNINCYFTAKVPNYFFQTKHKSKNDVLYNNTRTINKHINSKGDKTLPNVKLETPKSLLQWVN